MDVWPALPLIVRGNMDLTSGTDNIIAALGQRNRVRHVFLWIHEDQQLEEVLAAMQVSFPELTDLQLFSNGAMPPVIPDSFLDGSVPHLQYFELSGIPFPRLPKLLSSATHLSYLWLINVPHSGYISPEGMVALLSVLSSLKILSLGFKSPQSRPDQENRSLPPPKRSILPALDKIYFKGVMEYLEDLVIFIDAPQLNTLRITFFNQIDFDCLRLSQFIDRTPTLRARDEAHVQFHNWSSSVALRYQTSMFPVDDLLINILCREPDWQLSSIEQLCNSSLHPLSTVKNLYIEHRFSGLVWKNDAIGNTLWLQLLRPFTMARNLFLSKEFSSGIAAALEEFVGDGTTEVLPSLQNIFVEGLEPSGPFRENFGPFVAARQLFDHSITVSCWNTD